MAKGQRAAIPPPNKRARCSNPARYVDDSKLAFEAGLSGHKPPVWMLFSSCKRAYQAGVKQRERYIKRFPDSYSARLTPWEQSQRKKEQEKKKEQDALLEKQMDALRRVFEAQGVKLTRKALAEQLQMQQTGKSKV